MFWGQEMLKTATLLNLKLNSLHKPRYAAIAFVIAILLTFWNILIMEYLQNGVEFGNLHQVMLGKLTFLTGYFKGGEDESDPRCRATPYVLCEKTPPERDSEFTPFVSNPFFKARAKLKAGLPVQINYINMRAWPCEGNHACVYSGGNVTQETDVVIAHAFWLSEAMLPEQRWPGQIYVMVALEAPHNLMWQLVENETSVWRNVFNLTATYHRKSDIFYPYARLMFKPLPVDQRPDYIKLAGSKNRTALWIVSNCRTQSKRENYVKIMQKYMDVDVLGYCGTEFNCSDDKCLDDLLNQYMFFLAFENSLCVDYVTEKVFRAYGRARKVVPVVRGGTEYEKLFPEGTFIDAAKFPSAKDLALHLKDLSADLNAYSGYLERKDVYEPHATPNLMCTVCEAVTKERIFPRTYDIKEWLADQCSTPRNESDAV